MKTSTRNIIKMHGWRLDRAIHNYIYFVYYHIYVYLLIKAGYPVKWLLNTLKMTGWPFRMVNERYHAKVLTIDDAEKLLTLNEDVVIGPDRTERIIPYKYANEIILKEPEYIAVMDCACRRRLKDHCEPLDVCLAVGRTTAEFWVEHGQKYHARKINQEEALEILRKGHDRGNITTAWFKVATGGRTGVICSCCTCCCGALGEAVEINKKLKYGEIPQQIAHSGYVVEIDTDACVACGECVEVCFFEACQIDGEGRMTIDGDLCMGCGLCVETCDKNARTLRADPSRGLPLDIDLVIEKLGVQK